MRIRTTLAAAMVALVPVGAVATPMAFTDPAAFQAAIVALPGVVSSTLTFENQAEFDTIGSGASVEGITFTYDFGGPLLEINAEFDTTSPDNYLGTDDGGVLQDGDEFSLGFAASNAVGLFFTSADQLLDADITLTVGATTVDLVVTDATAFFADGGVEYFLGFVDDMATFTSADIGNFGGGFFTYSVDDITIAGADVQVPAPAVIVLVLMGLGLVRRRVS